MNTMTVTQNYEIADCNLDDVKSAVAKMNRRCRKLGVPEIEMSDSGMFSKSIETGKDRFGKPVMSDVIFHSCVITGIAPKVNGWQFIATVDHVTTEGNVVNVCPASVEQAEKIGMDQFRLVDATCDHCGKLRSRNATYVLYNEQKQEVKRVGHSCLEMFVGSKDIHSIAQYAEELHQLEQCIHEMDEDVEATGQHIVLRNLLNWVACSIRLYGWVSKGKASEEGRVSTVSNASIMEGELKAHTSTDAPNDDDTALAEKALTWIRSEETKLSIDDLNEYMWNLRVICKDNIVSYKHTGFAASLIAAYQKNTQQKLEKKVVSQWLDVTVGQKVSLTLTLTRISNFSSDYGTTYILNFVDGSGNKVEWFASNPFDKDNKYVCQEGETYTVTGTVKKLSDGGKYGKSTLITRCKVKHLVAA